MTKAKKVTMSLLGTIRTKQVLSDAAYILKTCSKQSLKNFIAFVLLTGSTCKYYQRQYIIDTFEITTTYFFITFFLVVYSKYISGTETQKILFHAIDAY